MLRKRSRRVPPATLQPAQYRTTLVASFVLAEQVWAMVPPFVPEPGLQLVVVLRCLKESWEQVCLLREQEVVAISELLVRTLSVSQLRRVWQMRWQGMVGKPGVFGGTAAAVW